MRQEKKEVSGEVTFTRRLLRSYTQGETYNVLA